ncbi:replication protein P [Photobacterium phosphoreum]|uniref:replication protein P n=1 Tax=Photobacterium phosphoreum TaxID=659 RepID=UPI0039B0337B
MKNITEFVNHDHITQRPVHVNQVNQIDDFAMQNINSIFKELCSVLPAWRNHLRTAEEFKATRASFAKGMMENGIVSMEQVLRGLSQARRQESDFFPSVGKFCSWCKGEPEWQGAFRRMLNRMPVQSLAEKRARQATSWAIRNKLPALAAERRFKLAFEKYQGLEEQGLLTELVQLPPNSVMTEFDKQRNSTTVRPEQFKANSVFARIAQKGANHE